MTGRPEASDPAALSLTVVGCDGSWVGPDGAGSAYVVRTPTTTVLLDCGPGSFGRLQTLVDPAEIAGVVLSHHHPDHWSDLHTLATHARRVLEREVDVYAPPEFAARTGLETKSVFRWHDVTGGDQVEIGDLSCTFRRTDHAAETLGVRCASGGRVLGYSADTGPGWSLVELGHDLDLALCEATYTAELEGTEEHLSGRQAGEQAGRAGARRLMITHRRPTVAASAVASEAAATFGRPVEQAVVGRTVVV